VKGMLFGCEQPFLWGERCVTSQKMAVEETSGIAVSSSPAIWGFSSFWLTYSVKEVFHGVAVPFICALLSHTGQYTMQNKTV